MDSIEQKETLPEVAYEKDYEIHDIVFFEPFVVYKPASEMGAPRWWAERGKVQALINAFKMDMTNQEACIQAGISIDQYKYFCKVHPHFLTVKARCKSFAPIVAKQGLMTDLANPAGFRTRQWYLERKQPHIYGRDIGAYTPPPAAAAAKVTAEAFLNEHGEVVMSRQTAEILNKEYGDSDETPESSE